MLTIYFGKLDDCIYDTSMYFDNTYEGQWIASSLGRAIIKDIMKADVLGGECIKDNKLGQIAPERLAGGVKTLLLLANDSSSIFNASTCGDNCAKWILKIADEEDITINLRHIMDFGENEFDIEIANSGEIVHNMKELRTCAEKYLPVTEFVGNGLEETISIKASSKRISCELEINGKYTILNGDSATGKSTLIRMINCWDKGHGYVGIDLECSKRCLVVSGMHWLDRLRDVKDSIAFIDNQEFVTLPEFKEYAEASSNRFVIITRECIEVK